VQLVKINVTDSSNNYAVCNSYVTIHDVTQPSITCPPNITNKPTDLNHCNSTNLTIGNATATDNCAIDKITNNIPSVFVKGANFVIWRANDTSGNSATCIQSIAVVDNQAPSITCPSNITNRLTDLNHCNTTNLTIGTASATDNCAIDKITNNIPNVFVKGSNFVTWRANDTSGNVATCLQQITVVDQQSPSIVCHNATFNLSSTTGTVSVTPGQLLTNATDNCYVNQICIDRNFFNCTDINAVQLVKINVTDSSNNYALCNSYVTIRDVTSVCP